MVRDPSIVSDRSPVCFAAHEHEPAPLACARTLGYDNDEDDTLTSAKTTPQEVLTVAWAAEILTL